MTEPYTQEEMREMFLDQCLTSAWYWSRAEGKTPREMCDGVVYSILNIIDGRSGNFPCAINLQMDPDPTDKEYCVEEEGQWVEPGQIINDNVMLHQLYCNLTNDPI